MEPFGLTQLVSGYTHVSPTGHTSLIDLAIVSSPSYIEHCTVIPPLVNSDHIRIHVCLSLRLPTLQMRSAQPSSRSVWRYSHANFTLAEQLICATDWGDLIDDDIDTSWDNWQSKFLDIMKRCIPKKVLPPKHRNLPWLSKGIVQAVRRRNGL